MLCGVRGLFVCLFAFFLRTRESGISIRELHGTCVYSKAYLFHCVPSESVNRGSNKQYVCLGDDSVVCT